MDNIISLFRYFSQFVPKPVLEEMFRQPERSQEAGYSEFKAEVLATGDNKVIVELGTFVCSANRKYVSDKIKNSQGVILFIEYGSTMFDPTATDGVEQQLAVTVCREHNVANNDNLNEALLMNECYNILSEILQQMEIDQSSGDTCEVGNLIKFPAEILPVDSETFFDRSGWTALFSNQNSIIQ
ncbi:MAG TPA: hypothetical protein PK941_11470 [Paludibacter sp.]|nr:hypothetical protein [Paludibacter sp.]